MCAHCAPPSSVSKHVARATDQTREAAHGSRAWSGRVCVPMPLCASGPSMWSGHFHRHGPAPRSREAYEYVVAASPTSRAEGRRRASGASVPPMRGSMAKRLSSSWSVGRASRAVQSDDVARCVVQMTTASDRVVMVARTVRVVARCEVRHRAAYMDDAGADRCICDVDCMGTTLSNCALRLPLLSCVVS